MNRNYIWIMYVIEECEIKGGPKDVGKTLNETGEGLNKRREGQTTGRMHSKETKAQSCNSF